MMKIGVTGSAGSGKSLVCEAFRRLGLETLDCDKIAREVVAPGRDAYNKVVSVFGQKVVAKDRSLDRAGLRKMIVEQPGLRKRLEDILHPVIIKEMVRQMNGARYTGEPACAVEVPLLFELDMAAYFDVVVVVTAMDSSLASRIAARDGVTRSSAEKMLALQMAQDEKIKRADQVIYNNGDKEELFQSVSHLYGKLKKSA
ncbi:MAG: dephospho-CoA kinase [Desulfobacter sp.]|nr:MAG: dephospho-CoA kinase [Desulfobacter sp.]